MSPDPAPIPDVERPALTALDIVRAPIFVIAIASTALWGFSSWSMPWNIILGTGTPLITLLLWALFLSPRPVLRLDPFLRAVVELLIYVGVTIAWWSIASPIVGTAFAAVAVVAGVISGRRALT